MGMTIAEKILAKKSGRDRVAAGDLVTVNVDTVVLFDNNFMPSIWQDVLKMEHPERVVVIIDHRAPAPTIQSAGAHRTARKFVEKFKLARFPRCRRHAGHLPPGRGGPGLCAARYRARVQRFAYLQRGRF